MKETLIVLLVFYSMYVGYFIKVNETTLKPAKVVDKILIVLVGFCGL